MVSGGLSVGRYELLSRIAVGGMGEVYVARLGSGDFQKRFAVKLLLPHLTGERAFSTMFTDEARIAARLDHPNITHISDFGEANGQLFIAMALVEGVSLSQLLKAARRDERYLPMPVVRAIAVGLCEGLHYAHTLMGPNGEDWRVVHRDVSPSNLLVSRTGAVLINDFGIAKAKDKEYRTTTGAVRGKLSYMPLEQLNGQAVDARADVYSAAVTLYEAATRQSPFKRETEARTVDAVRGEGVVDPRTLRSELGDKAAAALLKGTSRDPAARQQTARALLEEFLDGPIALPSEIGALVEQLCAEDLDVFRRGTPVAVGTADVVVTPYRGPSQPVSLGAARPRRWPWALAIAVLSVIAVGVWKIALEPVPQLPPPSPIVAVEPPKKVEEPPVVVRQEPAPPPRRKPTPPVVAKTLSATPKPHGTGFLTVDAVPWAAVSVDGREIDRTPLARLPLPAGHHTVKLDNRELGHSQQRDVEITDGEATVVQVDLR